MTQPISAKISVRGLCKTFGESNQIIALDKVDLTVEENSFVTLVGASGCGKSTLLRIIGGLEYRSSGEVTANGRAVNGPGADRAMVFQQYSLFPWLSVRENVRFSRMFQVNRGEFTSAEVEAASGRADTLISVMGLDAAANAYPHTLSGGMQQRVAIARADVEAADLADGRTFRCAGRADARSDARLDSACLRIGEGDHRIRHTRCRGGDLSRAARGADGAETGSYRYRVRRAATRGAPPGNETRSRLHRTQAANSRTHSRDLGHENRL